MTASDLLIERIPDASLRALVAGSSADPVSVIIELAVPDSQVEYATTKRYAPGGVAPARIAPMSKEERAQLARTTSHAKKLLDRVLAEPPVYLPSARAFVATAAGQEIGEIARLPFTKRIVLNRRLR